MTGNKKTVDFRVKPRPTRDELPPTPDEWVRGADGVAPGPSKRLTLNLPAALHTAFKARCVVEGVTIQDKVQVLIERELGAEQPLRDSGSDPA